MKKFIRLCIACIGLCNTGNLFAQIPSPGFEEWRTRGLGSFSVSDPKLWMSGNLFDAMSGNKGPLSVVKSTDAHSGQYAALIRPIEDTSGAKEAAFLVTGELNLLTGEFNDKFKLDGKPNLFEGYYKYQSNSVDGFSITLLLFKNGEVIGTANFSDSAAKSSYVKFSLTPTYMSSETPDSANISVMVGLNQDKPIDASLWIDDFSFAYGTTGLDDKLFTELSLSVYPNPAVDHVHINFEQKASETVTIKVFDMTGKMMETICEDQHYGSGKQQLEWNPANLPKGVYFILLEQQSAQKITKIILQ